MSSATGVRFGNGTCSTITVEPFTPICSKPAVAGSTPLTLDVPVPSFTPVVPPQECVCFTFTDTAKPATVTIHPGPGHTPGGTASVTIKTPDDADCCNGVYEVTPTITIDIPECLIPNGTIITEKTVPLGENGNGSITYKLTMQDCRPQLEIKTVPFKIPTIGGGGMCLANTDISLGAKYQDSSGNWHTTNSITINGTVGTDTQSGCPKYEFEDGVIDMTGLFPGFDNGGDVNEIGGMLFINGEVDENLPAFYGGGYGDWRADGGTYGGDDSFCRGPLMRYKSTQATDPSPVLAAPVKSYPVPVSPVETYFAYVDDDGWSQEQKWSSSRAEPCASDADATCRAMSGNLDMIWPTGVQWHTDGLSLALPLTEFLFNDAGILSEAQEKQVAALVSPGPATTKQYSETRAYNNRNITLSLDAGKNASGLISRPGTANSENSKILDGLRVNAGRGLHIYGVLEPKDYETCELGEHNNTTDYDASRQGALELYANIGYRKGDLGDFLFDWDGRLVINDSASNAFNTGTSDDEIWTCPYFVSGHGTNAYLDSYKRDHDCTVSVVAANYRYGEGEAAGYEDNFDVAAYWAKGNDQNAAWQVRTGQTYAVLTRAANSIRDGNGNWLEPSASSSAIHTGVLRSLQDLIWAVELINETLGTLSITQLHFAKAGVLMGADVKEDCQHIDRNYRPNP